MSRNLRILAGMLFLFCFQLLQAQNEVVGSEALQTKKLSSQVFEAIANYPQFESFAPFKKIMETRTSSENLKRAVKLQLNAETLKKMHTNADAQINLVIPGLNNTSLDLMLLKSDLHAEGFRVTTSESKGRAIDYVPGIHYRGIIKDQPNSLVAFSVFENEMIGMISLNNHNMVVLPDANDNLSYTLYDDKDISVDLPFSCDVLEHNDHKTENKKDLNSRAAGDCVRVYIECDYALYSNKGGTTNTVNYITAVFNNVATLYANESVNTTVSEVFVWTTADSYDKTSSINALNQFKAARPTFNGDLAHLAALGGNNIGGVAWLDALCSSYKYAYSNIYATYNNVPTYSWTVEVMTHEMGHNLGSNHTQWCGWTGGALDNCYTTEGGCAPGPAPTNGGTIMSYCHLTSYGINFNNGFGVQPGNKIRARIVAATCLGQTCGGGGGGGCAAPTGLNASNITQTSATISWNPVTGATGYVLEYKLATSSIWTVINTTATSYNLTGLTLGTSYNARVKTACGAQNSAYSSVLSFSTLGNSLYCVSKGVSAAQEWIKRVKLGTIDRASGDDGGYYDGTGLITNLTKGTSNTIYFQSGITGSVRTLYWRIWIDYNKNNSFNDPGELIVSGYAATTSLLYANFVVPVGAATGATRIRVAMKYGGLPTSCETFARGEVEDYSVNLVASGALISGNESATLDNINVYPNPTSEHASVSFVSNQDQKVEFKLLDMMKKEIRQAEINATAGENYFEMNMDNLANGQYIIAIRNGDKTTYKKILKM